MCNIVHTCIKKYTVAVQYSCKFCTARVFLFLADHAAIQFTNIHKTQRYLYADEAKGLLVPYVPLPVRRAASAATAAAAAAAAACTLRDIHAAAVRTFSPVLPPNVSV